MFIHEMTVDECSGVSCPSTIFFRIHIERMTGHRATFDKSAKCQHQLVL